jgi:hypothetical protein
VKTFNSDPPGEESGAALYGKEDCYMERIVQDGPDLLVNCAKAIVLDLIKI